MAQESEGAGGGNLHDLERLTSRQVKTQLMVVLPELERRLQERAAASAGEGMTRREVTEIAMKFATRIMTYLDSEGMRAKVRAIAAESALSREDTEATVVETVALAMEDPSFSETVAAIARDAVAGELGARALDRLVPSELPSRDEVVGMVAEGVEGALEAFMESDGFTQRILELSAAGDGGPGQAEAARDAIREALTGDDFLGAVGEAFEGRLADLREDVLREAGAVVQEQSADLLAQKSFQDVLAAAVEEAAASLRAGLGAAVEQAKADMADVAVQAVQGRVDQLVTGYLDSDEFRDRVHALVAAAGGKVAPAPGPDDAAIEALVEREVAARVEGFLESETIARRIAARVRLELPAASEGDFPADPDAGMHFGPKQAVHRAGGLLGKVKRLRRGR